ncbi:MAG: hypothetical protein HXY24_10840 [Rubrivivax sp.]|nr:hypothetical protein [Rubrivivax sp.]
MSELKRAREQLEIAAASLTSALSPVIVPGEPSVQETPPRAFPQTQLGSAIADQVLGVEAVARALLEAAESVQL